MKTLSILMMISSALMAMSNISLIIVWASLEINSMSFSYFLSMYHKLKTPISYLLIQFFGSIFLIAGMISEYSEMLMINPSLGSMLSMDISSNAIFLAMMIKMGAVPFHKWVLSIGKSLNWNPLIMFLTVQKLAPIMIMSKKSSITIQIVIIMSTYMGSLLMMSTMDMKMILNASSINHTGWMLAASLVTSSIMIFYFIMYSIMTIYIISFFSKNFNDSKSWQENLKNDNQMILIMMSMSGIPPTMGFSMKISVISIMVANNLMLISIMILLSSLINLYVYMKMSSKYLIKTKNTSLISHLQNKKTMSLSFHSLNLMAIPFMCMAMAIA